MFQRSNGIYYADFIVSGKRIGKSLKTKNKQIAFKREQELKKQAQEEAFMPPWAREVKKQSEVTLNELFELAYNEKWRFNKASESPLRHSEIILNLVGKDITFLKLDISSLIKKLEQRGISKTTLNRYRATLLTTIKIGQEFNLIPTNYKFNWKKHREVKTRLRFISKEVEQKARDLADRDMEDLISLLADTGCRLSEMLTLKIDNIQLDNSIILLFNTKSGKDRAIPLTKKVIGILENRIENYKKSNININGITCGELLNLTKNKAVKRMNTINKKLGKDRFTLHELRHTTASRLAHAGCDAFTIQAILGHSNVSTTERYVHMSAERLKEAMNILEDK